MDRNQAIGLTLICALLLVYTFFLSPPETEIANQETKTSISRDTSAAQDTAATLQLPDSLQQLRNQSAFGAFAAVASGQNSTHTLENENLKITFNSKGGAISEVELKNYKTWDQKPLILFDDQTSKSVLSFQTTAGKKIRLNDLYFQAQPVQEQTVRDVPAKVLNFVADLGGGQQLVQRYALFNGTFQLDYQLDMSKAQGLIAEQPLRLTWTDNLKKLEKDLPQNRQHSTLNFYTTTGEFNNLSAGSFDPQSTTPEEPLKWVANKQNFFTAGIIAHNKFEKGTLKSTVDEADTSVVKTLTSELTIPAEDVKAGSAAFTYFFGPNDYDVLKNVTEDFDKNVELGWFIFSLVNKGLIIHVFDFLENHIASYGIIIILLALFIKVILLPITYKMHLSTAKMRVLKPEIDAIKERNEGDMQKTQVETMQLYNEVGVNPLSGCIPMLLQIPILLAMFSFFPNAIELRQEPFLWANDLSSYDVFMKLPFTIPFYGNHVSLFVLLMTASTVLITWSTNQLNTMAGPMKYYGYMMPVIFMFVLNSYPSGLSLYYLASNLFSFAQQMVMNRFVDEDKIKAKLEENKRKRKENKKSGGPSFTQRMQEAMRAASEKEAERRKSQPRKK